MKGKGVRVMGLGLGLGLGRFLGWGCGGWKDGERTFEELGQGVVVDVFHIGIDEVEEELAELVIVSRANGSLLCCLGGGLIVVLDTGRWEV